MVCHTYSKEQLHRMKLEAKEAEAALRKEWREAAEQTAPRERVVSEAPKNCPHCGDQHPEAMWVDWAYRVVCLPPTKLPELLDGDRDGTGCGAYGPGAATEADAIAAWNTRAPDTAQAELLREARAGLLAIASELDKMIWGENYEYVAAAKAMDDRARATLAKLKGGV